MASSRPIAAGEDYTPDDINNLRNDVLDPVSGHKHNATDGAKVPFSNLDVVTGTSGSAAPAGGTKSYNDIANHVGSSQSVHNLGLLGHVLGSISQGLVVQTGTITGASGHVWFPHAFASIPVVFLTIQNAPGPNQDWPDHAGTGYRNLSATQFDIRGGDGANQTIISTTWMAIGVLA